MYRKEFEQECVRKDQLINLFEKLEEENRIKFCRRSAAPPERIQTGDVKVTKVEAHCAKLKSEDGKIDGDLVINPEIARYLRKGDDLGLTARWENSKWHVVFLEWIGSRLGRGF